MAKRERKERDPLLKRLYRRGIQDAVKLTLEEPVGSHIQWDTLEWMDKEILLPPTLSGRRPARRRIADLLARVKDTEGRYLEVLLHPELQSRTDEDMDWRALRYNAGATLQLDLPRVPVITLIFYHCRGVPGVQYHRVVQEFYGHETLIVGYWSVGLGELDAVEYAGKDNPMAWALASWMRQPRRGKARLRLDLQEKIIRRVEDEPYRDVLLETVRTCFKLNEQEEAEEQKLIEEELDREVREEMLTAWDKLRLEGRREGRKEGQREALQNALVAVLASKFRGVPDDLEQDVRKIQDLKRLDALIRRSAAAPTLEDALLGLRNQDDSHSS